MTSRAYDVIVLGSTGTVGKLVCEHLANHYKGIKWAMSARSRPKLEKLRHELSSKYSHAQEVPLLIADAKDQPALNSVVRQGNVVVAMSGPYAVLGTPVIEACLQEGTHYVDITGETQWIKRMIEQHHDEAAQKGVKIVHCCGYDSIPSDLGAAFMVNHIQQTYGRPCKSVETQVKKLKEGAGGGTIASLLGVFDEPSSSLKQLAHPYCLNPPNSRTGPDRPDSMGVSYNHNNRKWTAPFLMTPINTRIVRRSNALLGNRYGSQFSYRERSQAGNLLVAVAMSAGLTLLLSLAYFNLTRWLIRKIAPGPGTAPSRRDMERGCWLHDVIGETEEEAGQPGRIIQGTVHGVADPAFLDTARLAVEAGICLATQEDELKRAGMLSGGVLTPGSAMGMVLVKRLQAAGFGFEIQGELGQNKKA